MHTKIRINDSMNSIFMANYLAKYGFKSSKNNEK